jgi:uncharacterized Zn finger protein (UPF0148 family)
MHNCPGCNSPLLKKYVPYHEGEMVYCPECGWNEEDGDNYKAPTKDKAYQLRLEGM